MMAISFSHVSIVNHIDSEKSCTILSTVFCIILTNVHDSKTKTAAVWVDSLHLWDVWCTWNISWHFTVQKLFTELL